MSGRYLLDTNIVVAFFNKDPAILPRVESATELFLAAITLGELHFGAAKSGRPETSLERIEEFAQTCSTIYVDENVARWYGKLKAQLRRKGRPIPENDLWIAASSIEHDLMLVTRDRHFAYLDGLKTESW